MATLGVTHTWHMYLKLSYMYLVSEGKDQRNSCRCHSTWWWFHIEDKDYNLMGDHDDNHNHGHKKRGEILHLEKIITKKRGQTNITKIRTSIGRQGQGQGRRWQEPGQVERWQEGGQVERWKGQGTWCCRASQAGSQPTTRCFLPFPLLANTWAINIKEYKKNTWAMKYGWLMICYNHRHHHRRR